MRHCLFSPFYDKMLTYYENKALLNQLVSDRVRDWHWAGLWYETNGIAMATSGVLDMTHHKLETYVWDPLISLPDPRANQGKSLSSTCHSKFKT